MSTPSRQRMAWRITPVPGEGMEARIARQVAEWQAYLAAHAQADVEAWADQAAEAEAMWRAEREPRAQALGAEWTSLVGRYDPQTKARRQAIRAERSVMAQRTAALQRDVRDAVLLSQLREWSGQTFSGLEVQALLAAMVEEAIRWRTPPTRQEVAS